MKNDRVTAVRPKSLTQVKDGTLLDLGRTARISILKVVTRSSHSLHRVHNFSFSVKWKTTELWRFVLSFSLKMDLRRTAVTRSFLTLHAKLGYRWNRLFETISEMPLKLESERFAICHACYGTISGRMTQKWHMTNRDNSVIFQVTNQVRVPLDSFLRDDSGNGLKTWI